MRPSCPDEPTCAQRQLCDEVIQRDRPSRFTIVRKVVEAKVESGEIPLDGTLWDYDVAARRNEALYPVVAETLRRHHRDLDDREKVYELIDFAVDEIDRVETFARHGQVGDAEGLVAWSDAFRSPEHQRLCDRVRQGDLSVDEMLRTMEIRAIWVTRDETHDRSHPPAPRRIRPAHRHRRAPGRRSLRQRGSHRG